MDVNLNQNFKVIINNIDVNNKPNLFLHVCCAPCSTEVLRRLNFYFNIYIIYYNPNIDTSFEFNKRYNELIKLKSINNYNIEIIYDNYDHNEFLDAVKGLENCKEGGDRCAKCFELRLKNSFQIATKYIESHNLYNNQNYLCTTLSISPHKNAKLIYEIGNKICSESNLLIYLPSDFKKENGYLNSIKLSQKYELYRQNYCGCEFAKPQNMQ